jgi:hypothetical protein
LAAAANSRPGLQPAASSDNARRNIVAGIT